MRCFISLNIPEQIGKEIEMIQKKLPYFVGKKIPLENLHLTLKFFGEINQSMFKKIQETLKNLKFSSFFAEFGEIGIFSNDSPRILWVSLKGCENLQKMIDESLKNLFSKERRFMAHLTIARIKNLENKKDFMNQLEKISIPKIKFEIKEFCLMESILKQRGSEYKLIKRYGLV